MVEAAIFFPITIFVVFAMIYLGMVRYQDSILAFKVQKYATIVGRETAYPGYSELIGDGIYGSSAVDFGSGASFDYDAYFEERSDKIYNEWKFNYSADAKKYEGELEQILSETSFLTGFQVNADVEVENYVLAQRVKVKASYDLKGPKFLQSVGVPAVITLKTSVIQSASSPTELARNTDLAIDMISYLLEKLGLKGKVDSFFQKITEIKNKFIK